MAMFKRPKAGETDEDLIKQEEAFRSQPSFEPAAKVFHVNKRKTQDDRGTQSKSEESEVPRSKFARERKSKKKREGIVDNTVLKEAVSKEERVAVLGRVVERVVLPEDTLREWIPEPSPYGFPQAPKLNILSGLPSTSSKSQLPGVKRPSLYKQQLTMKGDFKETKPNVSDSTVSSSNDPRLCALGQESVIITSNIMEKKDAQEIHKTNMATISQMSHEERLKQQEEILSSLTPEQIEFIRSLRKAKEAKEKAKGLQEKESPSMEHEESRAVPSELLEKEPQSMEFEESKATSLEESSSKVGSSCNQKEVRFSDDVEMKEIPPRDEGDLEKMGIPISFKDSQKWLNMSKVEVEKLKALTDMPPPKPLKDKEGFVARFDFEGNILPYNKDVSHLEALHHHGEEAGRPGYSLDEIFVFCRSQVLQQRHLGLRTLANIFRNAKEGSYDNCVNPPVVHLAIEAGVVLILRFALDDASELVYKEAVRGLYYLVASEPDELCLSLARPFVPGNLEPGFSSEIHANDEARQELDTEEQELKDTEIIKLDVIRALMRMDTQARLRYLLDIIKPGPETVIQILGIFTRMARHSLTAAWKVFQTPHLISTIVKNFLPHNLSPLLSGEKVDSMTSVYGVPLKHALHFFRVLAAKGRQLASNLVNTHDIMSQVLTYVSIEPSEVSMPLQEALMLSQEAYALWSTFLSYGLHKAQEAFTSFYPMLVKQLVFYRDKISVNEDMDSNKFNYDVGAGIFSVMTNAVNVAASHSLLKNKMMLNQGTLIDANGKSIVLPPPLLTWEDVNDLFSLVEICLNKWLTQLTRCDAKTSFSALRLIGCCCQFLERFLTKWKDQTSYNSETCIAKILYIYNTVLPPFIKSQGMRNFMSGLVSHSSLISELEVGKRRDPVNLGSLGCILHGGKVIPVIQQSSPFPLLLPLVSLIVQLHSLHPGLDVKHTSSFLESEEMDHYLSRICKASRKLYGEWLTRIEVHFLFNVLQLGAMKGCSKPKLYHETALSLMPCIHKGDEVLIKELIVSVICAPEFTSDITEVDARVDDMALKDYVPLKSPALAQPVLSPLQLTNKIFSSLKSIGSELVSCLISKKEYEASVVLKTGIPFIINGTTIGQTESSLALEKHWPLTPIKYVYNRFKKIAKPSENEEKPTDVRDQSLPEDILTVTRCLQMTYLGLKYRRNCFVSETTIFSWLQHLSLVFLVASDMFLDASVSSYVQGCVVELLRNRGYASLEAVNQVKGFSSCVAWYKEMLQQFQGVSYGDSTFALFLLIPLQQYWDLEYRMQLWGDMSDALPFILLTEEDVVQFIPMEQFLKPEEEDEGLIIKYRATLGSRAISERRNPFLYKLVSHHVRHYLQKHKLGT